MFCTAHVQVLLSDRREALTASFCNTFEVNADRLFLRVFQGATNSVPQRTLSLTSLSSSQRRAQTERESYLRVAACNEWLGRKKLLRFWVVTFLCCRWIKSRVLQATRGTMKRYLRARLFSCTKSTGRQASSRVGALWGHSLAKAVAVLHSKSRLRKPPFRCSRSNSNLKKRSDSNSLHGV